MMLGAVKSIAPFSGERRHIWLEGNSKRVKLITFCNISLLRYFLDVGMFIRVPAMRQGMLVVTNERHGVT